MIAKIKEFLSNVELTEEQKIIAKDVLKEINASDELTHAICSHGYGICSDIKPDKQMEKIGQNLNFLCRIYGETVNFAQRALRGGTETV